ncbi:MAG: glycosyltransferase family 1 protein [Dehalococcoidia bacterium]|nr:MAG: glycosyltransferase family 1 protein [Dehalococcoidia bacterium]
MKIALVSPYDFAYPGGVTNHISSLEYYLTRMGHEVKVIAPASKAVTTFGDRFIPIGKPRAIPSSGSIVRVTISPWLSSRIKAVLDEENFDIIHLHEPLMPMLCTTVLRLSQTTNIGTFHAFAGRPSYSFAKPLAMRFLKKWFRKLDGKIAVSKPAMEFANKHLPGDYTIIPNGVDLAHFSPDVPPIDEFCDGKLNILFTGRLEKRKGANYLLKAYQRVKEEIPDSRLIIVGPGTRLRNKYEKHVKRHGLKDVVFIGYASYDDLPRYYKTADIFCAPATGRESFGIVLLEAMAIGKPIVASNIEGYASLLTHGAEGLLVPPKDKEALAQALISLMTDESLRQQMGARGILKAKEYDWKYLTQRILDYYISILSQSPQKEQFAKSEAISV